MLVSLVSQLPRAAAIDFLGKPWLRMVAKLPRGPCNAMAFCTEVSTNEKPETEKANEQRRSRWLVVGLGNPGSKFQGTRHNIGFDMIDRLAEAEDIKLNTIQCKALVGKGEIEGKAVLLVKPQTYMNLSGESVSPLAMYYKIPLSNILVVYDDMGLEPAIMKLTPKGSAGGHNGMKHIIEKLKGNMEFPRLRIGIGRPPGTMDTRAYVLQKFTKQEREEVEISLQKAVDGVRLIMAEGFDKAVSKWNPPRRSKDPTAKHSN